MKRLILAVLMMGILALAAQPAWYSAQPATSNEFYGRGAAKTRDKYDTEAKETALQEALSDVARQIFVQVKSYVHTKEIENDSNNSSNFLKEIQVESCVNLCNYNTVKDAIEKGVYYIVISVSRERLIHHYLNMVQTTADEAIASYDGSMKLLGAKNFKDALLALQQLRGKLIDLDNFSNILSSLYNGSLTEAVPQLSKRPRMGDVDAQIAELRGNPRQSYDDLAEDIISQFPDQLREPRAYLLSYIEWLNTSFSSEFSLAFSEHLAGVLERRFNWYRVSGSEKPELTLGGQLLPEGDRINILIRTIGKYNQTCTTQLSPNTIAHFGMDFIKPDKLEDRMKNSVTLVDEAVQTGMLSVKGRIVEYPNSPAVYRLGSDFNLQIKVNKPCYLTIMNVEADGRMNVITQNYPMSIEECNTWLKVFSNVTVTKPTGVEQLLIQASMSKMPEYATREEIVDNGTKNITDGTIREELAQTRGLMITQADKNEYSEYYLTWTVLEK